MQTSKVSEFPAVFRQMAQAIESLPDFDTLPALYKLKFDVEYPSDAFRLRGQLWSGDDFAIIANLNAWAAAIGGSLLLGDEHKDVGDGSFWRQLSVLKPLPGGLLFEVWGMLRYPAPAPADVSEPVAV